VLLLVPEFQKSIIIEGTMFIDEMFYAIVIYEIITIEDKELRGISRNQRCIDIVCDEPQPV
jgi:hypothetical protein